MTNSIRRAIFFFAAFTCLVVPAAFAQQACPCVAPNNGNGTVDLMPTNCQTGYLGFMQISTGLPPNTTIDCNAELTNFFNTTEVPGGNLGGNIQTWNANLVLQMSGTGLLNGFNRFIAVQVAGISHSAPRVAGSALQTFSHELVSLSGDLFGDPDFCTFRVRAGSAIPLPGSFGTTTLTRQGPAGADFQVDSFFDITYTIDFQGCPGSVLEGMNGVTENTHRFQLCQQPVAVQNATWGLIKALYQ